MMGSADDLQAALMDGSQILFADKPIGFVVCQQASQPASQPQPASASGQPATSQPAS